MRNSSRSMRRLVQLDRSNLRQVCSVYVRHDLLVLVAAKASMMRIVGIRTLPFPGLRPRLGKQQTGITGTPRLDVGGVWGRQLG